jgi:hypothetical protein
MIRTGVTVPQAAILLGLVGMSILLETAFAGAIRLPGHRALPGAFVLLLLSDYLAPLFLLGFSAVTSVVLAATGFAESWTIIGVWVVTAGVLLFLLARRREFARSALCFLLVGVLFGVLRAVSNAPGFHKTPEILRLAGHVAFGATGGLAAWAAVRGSRVMGQRRPD